MTYPPLLVAPILTRLCFLSFVILASLWSYPAGADDNQVMATQGSATGTIAACRPGDPKRETALRTLSELSERIESLNPSSSPARELADLKALLGSPCFELAEPWPGWRESDPVFAYTLQVFWTNGGEAWFRHFLDLQLEEDVYIWSRPTLRKALGSDTHPEHPLASLLCPLTSSTCGNKTQGWEQRAQAALGAFAESKSLDTLRQNPDLALRASADGCESLAKELPELDRWTFFSRCLQAAAPAQSALPLARWKAPDEGWWVVRGRRGHYSFCDGVSAYHLPTGAAVSVAKCGQLILPRPAQTEPPHEFVAKVGHVPTGMLREAMWMALLASEVQEDVVLSSTGVPLPPDVPPVRKRIVAGDGLGWSGRGGSHLTTLDWSWSAEEVGPVFHRGTLTWPEDLNHAGYQHAVTLLQVAEASFSSGCLGLKLPEWVFGELTQAGPSPFSTEVVLEALNKAGCAESHSAP